MLIEPDVVCQNSEVGKGPHHWKLLQGGSPLGLSCTAHHTELDFLGDVKGRLADRRCEAVVVLCLKLVLKLLLVLGKVKLLVLLKPMVGVLNQAFSDHSSDGFASGRVYQAFDLRQVDVCTAFCKD